MSKKLRQYVRTSLISRVKLAHPDGGTIEVKAKEISDGGIYVLLSMSDLPPIGSQVKVQLMDTPFEAPVLDMIIVRHEPDGIGLKFLE
ncbi:MAG: PilZ domain-containing protein [Thiotrichaceae bacterium]|nr:PilZ domain-containing protein [Thiotrichaceae bacterium]